MCTALFGSSPKITTAPTSTTVVEELEPMVYAETNESKKKKAIGTKRLQISLGSSGKSGLGVV